MSEKPKKAMMSGCKIHTPYLFEIPPVILNVSPHSVDKHG